MKCKYCMLHQYGDSQICINIHVSHFVIFVRSLVNFTCRLLGAFFESPKFLDMV